MGERYDAVVVGSGPNGLAAAITLAEAGKRVLVLEADQAPGGGLRTEELLEPGFRHDVCSTIMALPPLVPLFQRAGLDLVTPPAPLAHPFDDGMAVLVERGVAQTAVGLGPDAGAYRRLMAPLARGIGPLLGMLLGPIRPPRHPVLLARFGLPGLFSALWLAGVSFQTRGAQALLAGAAAHSLLALDEPGTGAVGLLMLASAHATGWPVARGGSSTVAEALAQRFGELGGKLECGREVVSLDDLPEHRAVLLDLAPRGVLQVAPRRFTPRFRDALETFRHGPGAFKMDWTLDGPIPWRSAHCLRAATVHLGGTAEEIAESELQVARGRHPARPFVLLVQASLFDRARAPAGKHVAWAYCHVPNDSDQDMTREIEDQVERFAPGFRGLVRKRSAWTARRLEREEPNCVGGDVMDGRMDLRGLVARPVFSLNPYATPDRDIFICSAATPPGGGVHGMCGVNAARAALHTRLR
ncbi:MAG TPA: NAD(P)/FAD-dependent oxidoreductase [Candidatus Dormibacteraeota bacterium]|nr:NAD(P)/FAD-dependent oxidoreductase [Candidatus Dormibacteraeota bacterium]